MTKTNTLGETLVRILLKACEHAASWIAQLTEQSDNYIGIQD